LPLLNRPARLLDFTDRSLTAPSRFVVTQASSPLPIASLLHWQATADADAFVLSDFAESNLVEMIAALSKLWGVASPVSSATFCLASFTGKQSAMISAEIARPGRVLALLIPSVQD
jgi:hypothetical protein